MVTVAPIWVYLTTLAYMWAGSVGMPAPEDIMLITAGAFSHPNANSTPANVFVAAFVGYFGIITGDSFIYFLGAWLGPKVTEYRWTRRLITPGRFEVIQTHYQNHGAKTVFVGRFLPGIRFMVFLAAGVTHYRYWKFILSDGIAALISAPLWVIVGYTFAEHYQAIIATIEEAKLWVGLGVGVLVVAFIAWKYWQYKNKKAAEPSSKPTTPTGLISKVSVLPQEG